MPLRFDWHKDSGQGWEGRPPPDSRRPAINSILSHRSKLWLLVLLLFLGGWLLFRQLKSEVAMATEIGESGVEGTVALLISAVTERDAELFGTLVGSEDSRWTKAQQELWERRLLFNRSPLGLWLDATAQTQLEDRYQQMDVRLAAGYTVAEVDVTLPYITYLSENRLYPIQLQRTLFLKISDDGRWQMVPADEAQWGAYVHERRNRIDLIVPERDHKIGRRLADDLDRLIEASCALPVIACPESFVMQLRLDRTPQSWLVFKPDVQPGTTYLEGYRLARLSLPAPTLVGMPVDEAGYEALLQGYGAHVSHAVERSFALETTADPAVLTALGLQEPFPLGFHPTIGAAPPPLPFPDKDILVMCLVSRGPKLFSFDLRHNRWQERPLQTSSPLSYFSPTPFPDDEGVILLMGPSLTDEQMRLVWLSPAGERLLLQAPDITHVLPPFALDAGRYLIIYSRGETPDFHYHSAILDVAGCSESNCDLQPFETWSSPSPDRRYAIRTRPDLAGLTQQTLTDARGKMLLELGAPVASYWLAADTVGYVISTEGRLQFKTATIDENGKVSVIERLNDRLLRARIPESWATEEIALGGVLAFPDEQPEMLFIYAYSLAPSDPPSGHMFSYEWHTDELAVLPGLEDGPEKMWGVPTFSDDGRYLFIRAGEAANRHYRLLDTKSGTWQSYFPDIGSSFQRSIDWSADGNWLLVPERESIRLLAPGFGYERRLYYGRGMSSCTDVSWLNRR